MSRIWSLGASLIALVGSAGLASAADISNTYEAPPAAAYTAAPAWSWSGPYAGLMGGYDWGSSNAGAGAFSTDGWGGGGFVGYNFQTANNLVFGVEGDVTGTGKSGSRAGYTVKNPWDATLRGRAGYAIDHFLIYGTGGLALGGVNVNDATSTEKQTRVGWTIGAGVDAAVTDNIIARMEFRHTDFGSAAYNSLTTPTTVSHSSNDLLVGVGMKF